MASSGGPRPSRIDTSVGVVPHFQDDSWYSLDPGTPTAASSNQGQDLPSFHLSTSMANFPITPVRTHPARNTSSKARNESRKLLSHVLSQLQNRTRPPPVYDAFSSVDHDPSNGGFGALVGSVKESVKIGNKRSRGRSELQSPGSLALQVDSDEEGDEEFSTDATFDLMVQLKDILNMSIAQGWQIFDDGSSWAEDGSHAELKASSPFRRSRNSFQSNGKRSRSPSPIKGQIQVPELLSVCISVLASVVLEDCRYKIASPRPSRPPNALQALTLNVAQFLVYTHRHDPKIISRIGFAIIPAFSTFQREMHDRLLTFFEEGILRGAMQNLGNLQGLKDIFPQVVTESNDHSDYSSPLSEDGLIVSIQVDGVSEDPRTSQSHDPLNPWSPTFSASPVKVESTTAPLQSLQIYRLASLVPPLLAAILQNFQFGSAESKRTEVPHRFHRLLDLIAEAKIDAYSDLLQIIAYYNGYPRKLASALLSMIWPKSIGHAVISRPLIMLRQGNAYTMVPRQDRTDEYFSAHQFVPWNFVHRRNWPSFDGNSQHDCRCCAKPINGFGLFCPFCVCAVHFDCYDNPEGNYITQYSLVSDPHVQRVAVYRFSNILQERRDQPLDIVWKYNHGFRPINLFSLCLCSICRKPLWGCNEQGYKCSSCLFVVHSTCLPGVPSSMCGSVKIDSSYMAIDWSTLRQSCLEFYRSILTISREQLHEYSYEEISIFFNVLSIQLQIITNGVALGSIVIMQRGRDAAHVKDHKIDEFELHRIFYWCQEYLTSDDLPCSLATEDFLRENSMTRAEHNMLFDWSNLVYLSSTMKSPLPVQHSSQSVSTELLNVTVPDIFAGVTQNLKIHPFEAVSISHMCNVLRHEFLIQSDDAARLLLQHLHHLAFFARIDRRTTLFDDRAIQKNLICVFPLPLGLDLSTDVETLVSSVEACLSDLDLSVNEFGFSLLVRRLWPNGMASEYGLKRLSRSIVSWVLAEDDNLATILRDFIAQQQTLPGVRSTADPPSWPSYQNPRHTPANSVNNGGDYVAARRALLSRYAVQWLFSLHNHDATIYADLLYETCVETASRDVEAPLNFDSHLTDASKGKQAQQCDNILRCIIKLSQASIVFQIFDTLFLRWLELVSTLDLFEMPMPSLHRLFTRESETSQRFSSFADTTMTPTGDPTLAIDPWRQIINQSKLNPTYALQWLCMFARSGIEIPGTIFMQFSSLVGSTPGSLSDALILVKAVMSSVWLRSMGRQELQMVFSSLHSRLSTSLVNCIKAEIDATIALSIIRQSLATCLLLYGCDRAGITACGLIEAIEIKGLPSRRKLDTRISHAMDPIVIDQEILDVLQVYSTADLDVLSCVIAKFFNMFLTESPFLEPYEIDNFILRNGKLLSVCAWQFYSIQQPQISNLRTSFLLRTLAVDAEPFQNLLQDWFSFNNDLDRRLLAVSRVFRLILDVTSFAFNVEGRQWRSSVTDIFYYFFSAMWTDPNEEVRLEASTFSATLLPAHLEAISLCWDESLSKAPVTERIKLISFLIQLRPHFPSWRVLSWDAVIDSLVEYDYDQRNIEKQTSNHQTTNGLSSDPHMAHLRVSIILLSLQMVADGINIESFTLMKLKAQLVEAIGFADMSVSLSANGHIFDIRFGEVAEISELLYPCVDELVSVLDAHHIFDMPISAAGNNRDHEERISRVLIGSLFVDVSLTMLSTVKDLQSLPTLTLRSLLEALYITIYKYDFESIVLANLQPVLRRAVLRALDLLAIDTSYELRQLALSVAQAFIKRWNSLMGSIVYIAIERIAKLIISQNLHSQDALATQGKVFIETTLQSYCNNGLFLQLLKRPLEGEVFIVLKQVIDAHDKQIHPPNETLRETLLRDTIARAVDCEPASFQIVLGNLLSYIEVVHHQGYSNELMSFVGQHLTHFVRRMSDWTSDASDPSPLLLISALLIQHNKKNSREMISYLDTLLRVALNRLHVQAACLIRLIQVTSTMGRRIQGPDSTSAMNNIVSVIYEILGEALRMKARVIPFTVKSMLEVLTADDTPGFIPPATTHLSAYLGLAESGYYFLHHHAWLDLQTENDFMASVAAAKMIFYATRHDRSFIQKLSNYEGEKSSRPVTLGVRSWNILAFTALEEPTKDWATMLFSQLPSFSSVYYTSLRPYLHGSTALAEAAASDVNHAYIAMKLWLMLAQRASMTTEVGELTTLAMWNELWPPFESILDALEVEAQAGVSSTLGTVFSTSVADLLSFVRILHAPLASQISTNIAILSRLRVLSRGESSHGKLTRALKSMGEPAAETSVKILLNQIAKEIIATEKLGALEIKREALRLAPEKRGAPDRYRRDARPL